MRNTPNYNLPQYEGTDKFTKEVLNDAFTKVDTAINDLQETFNVNGTGSAITTQEVVNARSGKQNLKERIDEIDVKVDTNTEQLDSITLESDIIYVEKFIKDNNITNDNDIVTNLINVVENKKIIFANRTYNFTTGISLKNGMYLLGQENTIFNYDTSFNTVGLSVRDVNNVTIESIKIQNNKPLDTPVVNYNYGISVSSVTNFKLEKVKVERFGSYGIVLKTVNKFLINNCEVYHSLRDGIHCFNMCENGNITNNIVNESGDDSIVVLSDINATRHCFNINITGNKVLNTRSRGININGAKNIVVSDNQVVNTKNAGLIVVKESTLTNDNIIIKGNTFKNIGGVTQGVIGQANQYGAIISGGATNIVFTENAILTSKDRGISVNQVSGLNVSNNIIAEIGSDGANIQNTDKLIMNGNTIENCNGNGAYLKSNTSINIINNILRNNGNNNQTASLFIESCGYGNISNNQTLDDRTTNPTIWFIRLVYSNNINCLSNTNNPSIAGNGTTNIKRDIIITNTTPDVSWYANGQEWLNTTNNTRKILYNSMWV